MNNGSNARLDRIEKIIETMVRAQRDREDATAKTQRERDQAQRRRDEAQRRRDEGLAKAQREREVEWEKRHLQHDREIRRIDARLSRFVKLGVAEARNHRRRMQALDATIKQLAAAQVVTEQKLQRFISSLGTNGFGRQA